MPGKVSRRCGGQLTCWFGPAVWRVLDLGALAEDGVRLIEHPLPRLGAMEQTAAVVLRLADVVADPRGGIHPVRRPAWGLALAASQWWRVTAMV